MLNRESYFLADFASDNFVIAGDDLDGNAMLPQCGDGLARGLLALEGTGRLVSSLFMARHLALALRCVRCACVVACRY